MLTNSQTQFFIQKMEGQKVYVTCVNTRDDDTTSNT